jgi:hypothetical protein
MSSSAPEPNRSQVLNHQTASPWIPHWLSIEPSTSEPNDELETTRIEVQASKADDYPISQTRKDVALTLRQTLKRDAHRHLNAIVSRNRRFFIGHVENIYATDGPGWDVDGRLIPVSPFEPTAHNGI